MNDKYILDSNGNPVVENDVLAWGRWYESANRKLAKDVIGEVTVSTVFLSLDHGHGDGPPVLWETMIFGGEHDGYQERYTSREDAVAGHARAVAMVSA